MRWSLALVLLITFIVGPNTSAASHHHHHHGSDLKIAKNQAFDFATHLMADLHHHAANDENIITSPISIVIALLTAYKGAAGKTYEELAAYLKIPNAEAENELSKTSLNLKTLLKKETISFSETSLAAGIFVQKDFPINKAFYEDVQKEIPAHIANLDFVAQAKEATDSINEFISHLTKGRIPSLFPTPLDTSTSVVLVSALYFHSVWDESFPVANTKPEKFFTGVEDIEVQMMNDRHTVLYHNNPSLRFEAVQLPYKDGYYMGIVLPYRDQKLMDLTHHLTGDDLNEAFYNATETGVDYKIPKMKFSWSKSLKDTLYKAGLQTVFEKADFSKMTPIPLRVTDVVHAAEIEVDEQGTKASAATAINLSTYSIKLPPTVSKRFYVDRPFMFTIFHKPTSIVLFSAYVHKPTDKAA